MIPILYVAHPIAGDAPSNASRARRWLRWLIDNEPSASFCVPWLPYIDVLDDNNPAHRARGMRDTRETLRLVDGIVLVGGRISTGMQVELDAVCERGGDIYDLTKLGDEPPTDWRSFWPGWVGSLPSDIADESQRVTLLDIGAALWEAK